ncbi:MAG: hypothetical protein LC808_01700 [Actinobacteria bacterium]|nr:hypothetical protein [Actinomycetota bacterium]
MRADLLPAALTWDERGGAARIRTLQPGDAIKTYRYLRMGMIGAVIVLGASIVIEHFAVRDIRDCWQTSISAYYYTPVRAVFVAMLFVVGFALIVIKGRDWEDVWLNTAGLLAPVVAIMPTTDIVNDPKKPGCWSHAPDAFPTNTKKVGDTEVTELASWVTANVTNNFKAYLIAAFLGLVAAGLVAYLAHKGIGSIREPLTRNKIISFVISTFMLVGVSVLFGASRDFFDQHAHGKAATGLFVCLFFAVFINAREEENSTWCRWAYWAIAGLMAFGALTIAWPRPFGDHTVFALEAWEIGLFAVYWLIQTVDNWNQRVVPG